VAFGVVQKQVRSAARINIENRSRVARSVVQRNAIAHLWNKEHAVAFGFSVVEAEIHTAVVEHPDAAAFIATRVLKDNPGRWRPPLLGLPIDYRAWKRCAEDDPRAPIRIHNR